MTDRPDWYTDAFPQLRPGPPWVMQEMIAAEPALVERLLNTPPTGIQDAADVVAEAVAQARPVTVCGCGTSEHAAHAVAAMLASAVGSERSRLIRGRPAFSAAQDPSPGVCIAISHDGATHATALALSAARAAQARTIAISQTPQGVIPRTAEIALITPVHDESWCHTVAYTSAMAAGAALAARLGPFAADAAAAGGMLARASDRPEAASIAERLADRRMVLCAAAEPDLVTARELALKIAEGTHVPTLALELETVLHGTLAAHESTDALVLVAITDSSEQLRVLRRATNVARAAAAIGLRIAALLSDASARTLGADVIPDGRLITPLADPTLLDPHLAGLLAGAGAVQSLTLELAHARGTNPDLIRRDQAPYRRAAEAAESADDS